MQPLDAPPLEHEQATPSPRWSGLRERLISGIALAALMLGALWLGGFPFILLVTMAALLMLREWDSLCAAENPFWRPFGLLYAGLPCASLMWLRELRADNGMDAGFQLVLFVILCVCATDIGAYFAGRRIGGPKLAPHISPGKTWAGFVGGTIASAIVAALDSRFTPFPFTLPASLGMGAALAVVAQLGDLFESWLKRRAGVKDSGTLIPGHGGLLDRVDGLAFAVPVFAVLVYFCAVT